MICKFYLVCASSARAFALLFSPSTIFPHKKMISLPHPYFCRVSEIATHMSTVGVGRKTCFNFYLLKDYCQHVFALVSKFQQVDFAGTYFWLQTSESSDLLFEVCAARPLLTASSLHAETLCRGVTCAPQSLFVNPIHLDDFATL